MFDVCFAFPPLLIIGIKCLLNETPVDLVDGHANRYSRDEVVAYLSLGGEVDFVRVLATSSTLSTIAGARICNTISIMPFPLPLLFNHHSPFDLFPQAQASPEGFVFS